eukprot:TCALIF_08604-PA protein Name:"Similar to Bdh1 D-beta-hydroxybutyrate dehydrogenase, mitochondrial (Rattus norvegicus)" AED:0.12 eAED:0.12 QI:0/0/0/1/1/1/5/0/342
MDRFDSDGLGRFHHQIGLYLRVLPFSSIERNWKKTEMSIVDNPSTFQTRQGVSSSQRPFLFSFFMPDDCKEEAFGGKCLGLYALINNAGVCVCGEFDWQTWHQIQKQIDVNLLGTLRVTKYCLPLLKAGEGRIINVSSVAGLYGYPGLSIYCATKHAMEGASAVLKEELGKFNIPVVTVQPGDFSKATHLLDNHHKPIKLMIHDSDRRSGKTRNMNQMWSEMSEFQREEYKDYFISYHNGVAKTGLTGKRIKPLTVLSANVIRGFEKAIMTKVPDEKYLLLPNWRSQLKMWIIGCLPEKWSQYLIARRYRKSLPKVVPSPLLGSVRSGSSTASTISSVGSRF